MVGGRIPAVVGPLSVTVFVTVIAGIVLWIGTFIVVSTSEQLAEFIGLLGRSWQSSHHILTDMITAAVCVPIISFLAVCVFRHASASEKAIQNRGKD